MTGSKSKLEEIIRDVMGQTMRRDIADRALAWLDQRIDAYKRLTGLCGDNKEGPDLACVTRSGQ